MGFGVSIFLITIGAIFKWAIKAHVSGLDLPALGVIFMVVGVASFILQIVLMNRQPKPPAPPDLYNGGSEQRRSGSPSPRD